MLRTLKLILPALLPSWNFFDVIVASPRIQYCCSTTKQQPNEIWHEVRKRPHRVSFVAMTKRLIWNPYWNETLYLVSCAERLMEYPTQHSEDEIFKRLLADIRQDKQPRQGQYIKFRLVFVRREKEKLLEEVTYKSERREIK